MTVVLLVAILFCGGCKQAEAADTCVTTFLSGMESGNKEQMQSCVSVSADPSVTALVNRYDTAALETELSTGFSDTALDEKGTQARADLARAYLKTLFHSTSITKTHHEGHGVYTVTAEAVMAYESRLSDEMYGLLGDSIGTMSDDLYHGIASNDAAAITQAAGESLQFAADRLSSSLSSNDYHTVTFVFTVQEENGSFYITSMFEQ